MTDKRSNQENQHTDTDLPEEKIPLANEPTHEKKESVQLRDDEETKLPKEAELLLDEEVESDEQAMADAEELDRLDQDPSETLELTKMDLNEKTSVEEERSIADHVEEEQEALELEAEENEEPANDSEEQADEGVQPVSESEEETREKRRKKRREKKPRLRLIPIWLRILISLVLVGGSLILGLLVGYGVIGGGEPGDAIKPETWYHILDIIRGN